ncbi:hypothetical protein EM59_016490 [Vibrio parahaemolyticus]|uniref:hypothetical protein n=1 Tax=Vibrio parahaemolyticus TaxID=670 RepID=UPI0004D80F90|nr:hypothetical protein [Vibrio parahaemolyticus]EGQ7650927.1 hypothetical protein [Vibrio parahaemolyticus]EGQ9979479.1 hypothetical protein [Vibrio parahaemolyticus]EJG1824809.1 hypothetical protein [Vibrio parahaemolyticus]ELB2744118.1 hypothetical protein [Vibrio parahaemolyticus]ELC9528617.1 hypothetical protein [Vibrio parahaemolyticus]
MTKSYSMNESQLQQAIQSRYLQQSKVGNGIVGQGKAINRIKELGYFERLEALAMQIDSEIRASEIKLNFNEITKLAKLERIFQKPENQNTLSHAEFLAIKERLMNKYGMNPTLNQVKSIMKESQLAFNEIKRLL